MCFRYATQNANVLDDAHTALVTGEIRTPSIASPETSEAQYDEKEILARSPAARTSDPLSSGKEVVKNKSERCPDYKSSSSEDDTEDSAVDDNIGSSYSVEEENTTTLTTTSEYKSTSVHDDNHETSCTDCTDDTSEVRSVDPLPLEPSS